MAVKCTNWREVELEFARAKEKYDRKAVEWLSALGERVVKYAREHGSYTDHTGNLRNSIGYVVVQYGKIATENFNIGSGHGAAKNRPVPTLSMWPENFPPTKPILYG